MKFLLIWLIAFSAVAAKAQNKLSIVVNPIAPFEPERILSAGVAVNMGHYELLAEPGFIIKNSKAHSNWRNLNGGRMVLQLRRYFLDSRGFYLGLDARDKIMNFRFDAADGNGNIEKDVQMRQNIFSIGVIGGREFRLSKNIFADLFLGFGYSNRHLNTTKKPQGEFFRQFFTLGLAPHYYDMTSIITSLSECGLNSH